MALELARELNLTTVAFVRDQRLNIYTAIQSGSRFCRRRLERRRTNVGRAWPLVVQEHLRRGRYTCIRSGAQGDRRFRQVSGRFGSAQHGRQPQVGTRRLLACRREPLKGPILPHIRATPRQIGSFETHTFGYKGRRVCIVGRRRHAGPLNSATRGRTHRTQSTNNETKQHPEPRT